MEFILCYTKSPKLKAYGFWKKVRKLTPGLSPSQNKEEASDHRTSNDYVTSAFCNASNIVKLVKS